MSKNIKFVNQIAYCHHSTEIQNIIDLKLLRYEPPHQQLQLLHMYNRFTHCPLILCTLHRAVATPSNCTAAALWPLGPPCAACNTSAHAAKHFTHPDCQLSWRHARSIIPEASSPGKPPPSHTTLGAAYHANHPPNHTKFAAFSPENLPQNHTRLDDITLQESLPLTATRIDDYESEWIQ